MHHHQVHQRGAIMMGDMLSTFPWMRDRDFSPESLEARYYLLLHLRDTLGYVGTLEKDATGKPLPSIIDDISCFWSLSHTERYTAFIVSDSVVGIDIAEYRERDIVLLDTHALSEYDIIGGKSWRNFYILWTTKEALIKAYGSSLDDISDMQLISYEDHISRVVFRGQIHTIQSEITDEYILSFTLGKNL